VADLSESRDWEQVNRFGDYEVAPDADTSYERNGSGRGRKLRPLTDLGNAERLDDAQGKDLFYVEQWRKWVVWDSTRWVLDGNVQRRAQLTVRAINGEAVAEDHGKLPRLDH
jgi:hypothetical protein